MGNKKQNFIVFKGSSRYSDIVVEDPRSARSHDNLLKLDPGSGIFLESWHVSGSRVVPGNSWTLLGNVAKNTGPIFCFAGLLVNQKFFLRFYS